MKSMRIIHDDWEEEKTKGYVGKKKKQRNYLLLYSVKFSFKLILGFIVLEVYILMKLFSVFQYLISFFDYSLVLISLPFSPFHLYCV